jgi:hypothetical protein
MGRLIDQDIYAFAEAIQWTPKTKSMVPNTMRAAINSQSRVVSSSNWNIVYSQDGQPLLR